MTRTGAFRLQKSILRELALALKLAVKKKMDPLRVNPIFFTS
ncbi:hypothetical protein [Peribacillus sp. NPDC097895]